LIRPSSEAQSGIEGLLRFPNIIVSFGSNEDTVISSRALTEQLFAKLCGNFSLSLADIRLGNLDTIGMPLELFNLTGSPSVLRNTINMGTSQERPLIVTVRVASNVKGNVNEIDLSASINSLTLLVDFVGRYQRLGRCQCLFAVSFG
jgi:hypothetical protein